MAINSDRLSLWEIAFRWHGHDPHRYASIPDIPLDVKDTLRVLAAEIYFERLYSDLRLEREARQFQNQKPPKNKPKLAIADYANEFKACIEGNEIAPEFLTMITIPKWELEVWCHENNIPRPSFWTKSVWRGGNQIPLGETLYTINRGESEQTSGEPGSPNSPAPELETTFSQQQQAAFARREPEYQLKRECARFSLTLPEMSANEIARRFYDGMQGEKKKVFAPTNAENTLAQAIRDFRNRDKLTAENKLPYWLIDFDPAAAQN